MRLYLTNVSLCQGRQQETISDRQQQNYLRLRRGGREEICDGLQQLHRQNVQHSVQGWEGDLLSLVYCKYLQAVSGLSSVSLSGSSKKKIPSQARVYSGSSCEWIDLNKVSRQSFLSNSLEKHSPVAGFLQRRWLCQRLQVCNKTEIWCEQCSAVQPLYDGYLFRDQETASLRGW